MRAMTPFWTCFRMRLLGECMREGCISSVPSMGPGCKSTPWGGRRFRVSLVM